MNALRTPDILVGNFYFLNMVAIDDPASADYSGRFVTLSMGKAMAFTVDSQSYLLVELVSCSGPPHSLVEMKWSLRTRTEAIAGPASSSG